MQTSPSLPILPTTPIAIRLTERMARDLLALGEIVPATLVAALDSHRALIQIKGRQLTAEIPFPLPDQGEFQVRVEQVEPRIVLRLLAAVRGDTDTPEARLKAYLAGDRPAAALAEAWTALSRIEKRALPEEIREVWTGFQETLKASSSRLGFRPVEAFKDLINLSGLNWENKWKGLALQENEPALPIPIEGDLKGCLLSLKSRLGQADPDLAQALQPILQKIELCQWLNVSESGQHHLLLFFPWWLPEGPGWAELLISGDRFADREPAGEAGQSLLFLLHLPVLGKLRVEVTIRGNRLYGRFKTEIPAVGALLDRQIPRLKSGLSSLGYQAALESLVVDPEQLGDSLPVPLENFSESLISRVV